MYHHESKAYRHHHPKNQLNSIDFRKRRFHRIVSYNFPFFFLFSPHFPFCLSSFHSCHMKLRGMEWMCWKVGIIIASFDIYIYLKEKCKKKSSSSYCHLTLFMLCFCQFNNNIKCECVWYWTKRWKYIPFVHWIGNWRESLNKRSMERERVEEKKESISERLHIKYI